MRPVPDPVSAGALALQRVLALEGRNALSRVALAASELEGRDSPPAVRERLDAIREAVDELDSVLDRIERLADPERGRGEGVRTRLAEVWPALAARLSPAFAARGLALASEEPLVDAPLARSGAALERLLLVALRSAAAALESESPEAPDAPIELVLASAEADEHVVLELRASCAGRDVPLQVPPAARVDLDVALAEVHARPLDATAIGAGGLAFSLPRGGLDG